MSGTDQLPSTAGTTLWPLPDNQGTVRDLVDSSGTLQDHITYSPFGSPIAHTSIDPAVLDFHFEHDGSYYDASDKLEIHPDRVYDALIERRLTPDPSGLTPDSNRYRPVANSPTNLVDPSGLNFFSDYLYYLTHPSKMDSDLRTAQKVALGTAAIAAGGAAGLAVGGAVATSSLASGATAAEATALGTAVGIPVGTTVGYVVGRPLGKDVAMAGATGGGLIGGFGGFRGCPPSRSASSPLPVTAKGVGDLHPTFKPGPFAGESIPATSTAQTFTAAERAAINEIGAATGCHTCGTTNPGTKSGNFVLDHQPPSALNASGAPQRLFPQCINCSREQGLAIARYLKALLGL